VYFRSRLAEFEAELVQVRCSFTSVILTGHYSCRTALTWHRKNAQKQHTSSQQNATW